MSRSLFPAADIKPGTIDDELKTGIAVVWWAPVSQPAHRVQRSDISRAVEGGSQVIVGGGAGPGSSTVVRGHLG